MKKEAEQIAEHLLKVGANLNEYKVHQTDPVRLEHERSDAIKLILASFERVSREVWGVAYESGKLSALIDDYENVFEAYWKSITNK